MKYLKLTPQIIILFVLISIAYSIEDLGIVYNVKPSITLDFTNETDHVFIDSRDFNLTNSSGAVIDYFSNPVESPAKIFKFIPKPGAEKLKDNEQYIFTVRYHDGAAPPNYDISIYTFTIKYPELSIRIVEPIVGVSPVIPFDFIIRTDRWAICRYSFLDQSYDNMVSTFSSNDNLLHKKTDFTSTGKVYVRCKDEYGKITAKSFILSIDPTPPEIVYKHADDVNQLPIETTLIVRTNEETVCKYYFGNSQIDYVNMKPFPGYNETNENSYKIEHQQSLGIDDLIDRWVNRGYLRCKNKAGLLSVMDYIDINVDTSVAPAIIINSPARYISDATPLFDVTTNKDSICEVANNSDMNNAESMYGVGRYHSKELINTLQAGTYIYYVQCIFAIEGARKTSVTFSVDNTPPSILYVNMLSPLENRTDKTYKDDELCAEWKAEDNESSISLYAYYVYWDRTTDDLIEDGTTTSNEECVGVDLNNTQKYYFTVSAKNNAELWSPNVSSSSIEVDTSLAPAGCSNGRKDGDETDVDCGGSCKGCVNGKNCLEDSDCDNRYCNASNKCAMPRCDDDVKNGAETDVDCGGNCKKCDVDKFCNKNTDCKSNNCDVSTGKCAAVLNKCENNQLDVGETDVDCGGVCPACGIGENCDLDSDCVSTAECKDGVCTARQLDSDGDGVNDDKDNCKDIPNADQADVDSDGIGDVCDNDSDNDGLPDSFEQQYFDCVTCANPNDDPDKDGLTNLDEYKYNTNPTKNDTDGDGYSDGKEIEKGTDPLDKSSHPKGGFLKYLFIVLGLSVLGVVGYFGYKVLKEKKFFVTPKAPVAKKEVGGMPIRWPMGLQRRPMVRPRMMGPMRPAAPGKVIKPAPAKPVITEKPEIIKKGMEVKKQKIPAVKPLKKKEEENIFEKLSKIAKEERQGQIEKKIKSLKLTDEESKERLDKLKKELNIK